MVVANPVSGHGRGHGQSYYIPLSIGTQFSVFESEGELPNTLLSPLKSLGLSKFFKWTTCMIF